MRLFIVSRHTLLNLKAILNFWIKIKYKFLHCFSYILLVPFSWAAKGFSEDPRDADLHAHTHARTAGTSPSPWGWKPLTLAVGVVSRLLGSASRLLGSTSRLSGRHSSSKWRRTQARANPFPHRQAFPCRRVPWEDSPDADAVRAAWPAAGSSVGS